MFARSAFGSSGGGSGDLLAANNLSDLANAATARTNLGLGAAAVLGASAGGNGAADSGKVAVYGAVGDLAASVAMQVGPSGSGVLRSVLGTDRLTFFDLAETQLRLRSNAPFVSDLDIFLPGASGTLALTSDIPAAPSTIVGISGTIAEFNTACSDGDFGFLAAANSFTAANTFSVNGAASTPAAKLTGTWFTGGTATTTKPQLLVEPTGATSTNWSTSGTGIGVNAASGFTGNLLDLQTNGATSRFMVNYLGRVTRIGDFTGGAYGAIGASDANTLDIGGGAAARSSATLSATSPGLWLGWGIGASATSTNPPDAFFMREAAAIWKLGIDAAGVTNQHLKAANRITSDGVGANLTISAGNGRGGAGGSLILSTYTTGAAATAGVLTTRLTLDTDGVLTFADGVNMVFGGATGTKIGSSPTEMLAFYGASPVTQQASVGSPSGGATVDTEARVAIDAIILRLSTLGLIST